jgi:hypothetical protein
MTYVNPPMANKVNSSAMTDLQEPGVDSITLDRDVLNKLYEYRRETGSATWEQAIERLLAEAKANAAVRGNMIDLLV